MGKSTSHKGLWLGGLSVGLFGLLLASRREEIQEGAAWLVEEATEVAQAGDGWMRRVIARVSAHEGRHDSLNLNADGAGLSFGILQWAQRPGSLGVLLKAMYEASPHRFITIFGEHWRALLQVASVGSLEAVGGALLWQEPWVGRFRAAGREPIFIQVQDTLAAEGDHFKAATEAARTLGIRTERSVALMYDTAVQQGPGFARRLAERVSRMAFGPAGSRAELERLMLRRFAKEAPAHFRRTTAPTEPYPVAHIQWRQVGPAEWHAWAGRFDLYSGILERRMGIVEDPGLSDSRVLGVGV